MADEATKPTRSAEELLARHKDYEDHQGEWTFFGDSYYGGRRYIQGGYLHKHPNEKQEDFNHRQEVACYYNFCQEVVDLYVSYLFQAGAEINYGSLANDPLFDSFLEDADLKGNGLKSFLREGQRSACNYGHVGIMVDSPKRGEEVKTRKDERDQNIRPYLYRVLPTQLVDWAYERVGTEGYKLTMVKILESEVTTKEGTVQSYRIWTLDSWEAWELKDQKTATLIDYGTHDLGEIPLVILQNLASEKDVLGRSDLNDIAYINKHIFNLCSWNDENIENTCFAMLAKAKKSYGEDGRPIEDNDTVGPGYIIEYDPELPNDKPFWIEPPSVVQEVFDKRLAMDIQEIHRVAKMGGVGATEVQDSPKSGVALELEFRAMNSTLSEKADNLEEAHRKIADLWAKWQGQDEATGAEIAYPDDFNVEDLAEDLENAINAVALRISSTFNTELKKKLARVALPKADPETKAKIEQEIEAQRELFIPAEFGLMLSYNLTNPVALVMKLYDVEEAEAIKLLEANRALNDKYGNRPPAPDLGSVIPNKDDDEGEED